LISQNSKAPQLFRNSSNPQTSIDDDYVNIAKGVYILNHFIDGYVDTEYNIMDTDNRLKNLLILVSRNTKVPQLFRNTSNLQTSMMIMSTLQCTEKANYSGSWLM
jgi:tmRNA-binding protein